MRALTVNDVEETLLDSLLDLHEELLNRQLECTDEQAQTLLRRYQEIEDEILMLLSPDLSTWEGIPQGVCPC